MTSIPSPRIALVTGATRGIGLETVRQLAEAGVHTLLAGRNRERAIAAALVLQSHRLPVEALTLDVTDEAGIEAAAAGVERRHGRLDILVNNAGILIDQPGQPVSAQSLQAWRTTFETNLFGLVAVTRAFLPLLRRSPAGRIVNVSSILGSTTLHARPGSPVYDMKVPAYSASKAAVNAWTVHLAWELKDTPVRVNAIHPGYVRTDMNRIDGEQHGELAPADGARTSVQLALAGDDAPNGGFFHLGEVLPW
jgi:NAD(P)-dependent dehydrogenase (short-subunit alcohol dehydrogenase family)